MNFVSRGGGSVLGACIVLAFAACLGCQPLSEQVKDRSVGRNGGFEHTRDGLPVNWLVYTPSTVPTGDFDIILDRTDFKEGTQSLKFLVRECSPTGGWHSPGIGKEYPATPGATYRISFWIKSEESDWTVGFGGVAPKTGESETVDSSSVPADSWQHVERQYTMPEEYENIGFGLSIRSPGTVWIDDVRIEPAEG
jgi:hypothetical protein